MRHSFLLALALVLSGCATTKRQTDVEQKAYECGYRQAVQEQYWIIQNQQRRPPALPSDPTNR